MSIKLLTNTAVTKADHDDDAARMIFSIFTNPLKWLLKKCPQHIHVYHIDNTKLLAYLNPLFSSWLTYLTRPDHEKWCLRNGTQFSNQNLSDHSNKRSRQKKQTIKG